MGRCRLLPVDGQLARGWELYRLSGLCQTGTRGIPAAPMLWFKGVVFFPLRQVQHTMALFTPRENSTAGGSSPKNKGR